MNGVGETRGRGLANPTVAATPTRRPTHSANGLRHRRHASVPAEDTAITAQRAEALPTYLAETLPADGQSFDEYMQAALARWPGLSDAEIRWAIASAASMCRHEGQLMLRTADLMKQATRGGDDDRQ